MRAKGWRWLRRNLGQARRKIAAPRGAVPPAKDAAAAASADSE
jgi:hypothetical protein